MLGSVGGPQLVAAVPLAPAVKEVPATRVLWLKLAWGFLPRLAFPLAQEQPARPAPLAAFAVLARATVVRTQSARLESRPVREFSVKLRVPRTMVVAGRQAVPERLSAKKQPSSAPACLRLTFVELD